MLCPKCNAPIKEGQTVCENCGEPLPEVPDYDDEIVFSNNYDMVYRHIPWRLILPIAAVLLIIAAIIIYFVINQAGKSTTQPYIPGTLTEATTMPATVKRTKTTVAETTEPTTVPPTTVAPTTIPPVTIAPVTVPPVTTPPTTTDPRTDNEKVQEYAQKSGMIDAIKSTGDENMTVTLHFDPQKGGECYLYMKNIQFRPTTKPEIYSEDPAFDPNNLYTPYKWKNWLSPYDKYWIYKHMFTDPPLGNIKLHAEFHNGENIVTENEVNYILPDNEQFYSGRQDFLLNSYTLREGIDSIVLTFPVPGVYHFDEFSLISEPLTTYEADAKALAKESLENVNIHQDPSSFVTSTVTGEITVSDSKLLCLTIPYSEGWKAYVDGQPALIENVNIMFSGIMLTPGHHTIELRYETPGLLYGVCLTAAGILLFLFWMIMSLRSGRGRAKADQADDADSADQTDPADLTGPADLADAAGLANPADQAGPADQADHRPNAEEIIPDAGSPGMNSADAAGGEPDASSALAGTVPESADMPENPEAESK